MIAETIRLLRAGNYYGAGEVTERAKGKYQLAITLEGGMNKIRRRVQGAKWKKKLRKDG